MKEPAHYGPSQQCPWSLRFCGRMPWPICIVQARHAMHRIVFIFRLTSSFLDHDIKIDCGRMLGTNTTDERYFAGMSWTCRLIYQTPLPPCLHQVVSHFFLQSVASTMREATSRATVSATAGHMPKSTCQMQGHIGLQGYRRVRHDRGRCVPEQQHETVHPACQRSMPSFDKQKHASMCSTRSEAGKASDHTHTRERARYNFHLKVARLCPIVSSLCTLTRCRK